eukprot:216972-Hanusia_phi.AAC.1
MLKGPSKALRKRSDGRRLHGCVTLKYRASSRLLVDIVYNKHATVSTRRDEETQYYDTTSGGRYSVSDSGGSTRACHDLNQQKTLHDGTASSDSNLGQPYARLPLRDWLAGLVTQSRQKLASRGKNPSGRRP